MSTVIVKRGMNEIVTYCLTIFLAYFIMMPYYIASVPAYAKSFSVYYSAGIFITALALAFVGGLPLMRELEEYIWSRRLGLNGRTLVLITIAGALASFGIVIGIEYIMSFIYGGVFEWVIIPHIALFLIVLTGCYVAESAFVNKVPNNYVLRR